MCMTLVAPLLRDMQKSIFQLYVYYNLSLSSETAKDQGTAPGGALVDEFSDLDKAMEEINDSIVGMSAETVKPSTPGSADELSDDDTDSEDEEGMHSSSDDGMAHFVLVYQ